MVDMAVSFDIAICQRLVLLINGEQKLPTIPTPLEESRWIGHLRRPGIDLVGRIMVSRDPVNRGVKQRR